MILIVSSLVFLAVFVLVAAVGIWLVPTRSQQRLADVSGVEGSYDWQATVVRLSGPLARLSAPDGDWADSPLRLRFLNAGIRNRGAQLVFFAAKTALPLFLAAVVYTALRAGNTSDWMLLLLDVMTAALVGCYLPNLWLMWRIRARKREIFENFPDSADLMLVCVEAGLGLDAAIAKVSDEMTRKSPALAEELHLTTLEIRAGQSREQALRNLATRTGVEETSVFASMLTQADKFGTSIGDSLRVFSDDLRHKRQMRAEEKAAKVPTKMLFPLVLCIFPAVLMVVLGPAIIQIIRTLAPMLSGGV